MHWIVRAKWQMKLILIGTTGYYNAKYDVLLHFLRQFGFLQIFRL